VLLAWASRLRLATPDKRPDFNVPDSVSPRKSIQPLLSLVLPDSALLRRLFSRRGVPWIHVGLVRPPLTLSTEDDFDESAFLISEIQLDLFDFSLNLSSLW